MEAAKARNLRQRAAMMGEIKQSALAPEDTSTFLIVEVATFLLVLRTMLIVEVATFLKPAPTPEDTSSGGCQ